MPGEWVEIVNVDEPTPPVELEVHAIGGGDVESEPDSLESEPVDDTD